MRNLRLTATLLAAALPVQPILAQAAPADAQDSPEEIAKDAARDLKDNRFYNKPGATRADYDADWQECRLIARGSRTPTGTVPTYYNNPTLSPIGSAIGGAIGGAIAAAIAEGQQRRANRQNCLLIKGWRLVKAPAAEATRVAALSPAQRDAYLNSLVGASEVKGEVTERTEFELAPDPMLRLDGPVAIPGTVQLGRKVDPAAPVVLGPDEAAVVLAFRRPDAGSARRAGAIDFARYDIEKRDLVYQPRDWKKTGDRTTYVGQVASVDKTAPYEVHVMRLTPGDYVLKGMAVNTRLTVQSLCFGAPTFHVEPGQVVYLGDFVPLMNAKRANGDPMSGMAYTRNLEDARRTLGARQPGLATVMVQAEFHDRATYACSAIMMDRWDLPDTPDLPPPNVGATSAEAG